MRLGEYDAQYRVHVAEFTGNIDEDFWQRPQGIEIEFDPLKFLYIPDHVSTFVAAQVARKVYRYQVDNIPTGLQISKAVIITMGGMLPGVLLHDHLAWRLNANIFTIEFGTLGVKYYAGPGQPLDAPQVVQEVTVDVKDQVVGVVEDLIDLGGTARFVSDYLREKGVKDTVLIAPYLKSRDILEELHVIYYGFVPKDTWIITPREKVETLIKRVPFWRDHGASLKTCRANLERIGYPAYLLDIYLEAAYEKG
jgi:hypoxanthine phosphoribosyltransferase